MVQHLHHTGRAGQRTGEHQKHVGDHHQRVHDLQHITQKAGEFAHLHTPRNDHITAEPEQQRHRRIHGELEGGQVHHRIMEGALAGLHQAAVYPLELLLLILAPHEGLYRPDGGQILLHDHIHPVHSRLQPAVHGRHLIYDKGQHRRQHRHAAQKDQAQPGVHEEGQPHAHDQHGGTAHHGPQPAAHRILQYRDVGGHAGDQRGCLEPVQIREGILLDFLVLLLTQNRAETTGCPGHVTGIEHAGHQREQGAHPHLHAFDEDVIHIPVGHAHVDGVSHNHRNEHFQAGFQHHKQHCQNKFLFIAAQMRENTLQLFHSQLLLFLIYRGTKRPPGQIPVRPESPRGILSLGDQPSLLTFISVGLGIPGTEPVLLYCQIS